jgi:hypothetical protein
MPSWLAWLEILILNSFGDIFFRGPQIIRMW